MDRSVRPVRRARLRLMCLVILFAALCLSIACVALPRPEPVDLGAFVTGAINQAGEVNAYTFSANIGDSILVHAGRSSGDLYPLIRLYGPPGILLGESSGASEAELLVTLPDVYRVSFPLLAARTGAALAAGESYPPGPPLAATAPGTYTLLISDSGTYTGGYGLFVQRTNNPGNATAITPGQTLAGTIAEPGQMQTFAFDAAAGDAVQITMARTSGSVYPAIELYDPTGSLVGQNSGAVQVQVTRTLSAPGVYTILAGDYDGTCTGGYNVNMVRVLTIKPPTGRTWALPFQVMQIGQAITVTNFDISAYAPRAPAAGVAYYVSTTGSDANSGLDAEHPLRKVSTALQKADVGEVHIAEGVYSREAGGSWTGTEVTRSVAVYGHGKVILTGHQAGLSWAPDGTLTHTYKATRSGGGACWTPRWWTAWAITRSW